MAKKEPQEIDQALVLDIVSKQAPGGSVLNAPQGIAADIPHTGANISAPVDDEPERPAVPKRRRRSGGDYADTFLQETMTRKRCSVYLSDEMHSKVAKIVGAIGERNISISGYIENIISEHLERFRDEINGLYEQRRHPDKLI